MSIVIPCYNGSTTLALQLDALVAQNCAVPWEVIVADNGSTDGSLALVETYCNRLPALQIVDASDRRGASHARNRGVAAATGDTILFCDADDVVGEGWMAAMAGAMAQHKIVGSRFELDRLNGSRELNLLGDHPQQYGLQPSAYAPYLPRIGAGGMGINRVLFEALGGFDETLSFEEDTDLCFRAQIEHGAILYFERDAVMHVRARADIGHAFQQFRNWGRYNTLLRNRYNSGAIPESAMKTWSGYLRTSVGLLFWLPQIRRKSQLIAFVIRTGFVIGQIEGCFDVIGRTL